MERDLRFLSTLLIALDKDLCRTWGHPKFLKNNKGRTRNLHE